MSTEQKYNWLLSQLRISDIDLYEQDALLRFKKGSSVYFQFSSEPKSVDEAVELAMNDWYRNSYDQA